MSIFYKIINSNSARYLIKNSSIKYSSVFVNTTSLNPENFKYDRDPGIEFIKPETQTLLKSMTGFDLERIFRQRPVRKDELQYKFMTTEEIEIEFKSSAERAKIRLQMPPVVQIKEDKQKIITYDPKIQNFDTTKMVFTDVTYGVKDVNRTIVVRQIDGTLEYCQEDVRKRLNQLYFPLAGRKIRTPLMFTNPHLKDCLDQFNYEFILDRLCIQFDPFELDYHRILTQVHLHINESKQFDMLRSTRHFGPMVFFLAWHKLIDDLLIDMIQKDLLKNAVELICLMYNLNGIDYNKEILTELNSILKQKLDPIEIHITEVLNKTEIASNIGKTEYDFKCDDLSYEFIQQYLRQNATKKIQLEMSLLNYKDVNDGKKKLLIGVKKAHGVV